MMYRDLTITLLALALLAGCSEDSTESARTESAAAVKTTEPATVDEQPAGQTVAVDTATGEAETPAATAETSAGDAAVMDNGVIYQEEIYRNWPYTEAPPADVQGALQDAVEEVTGMAEEAGQQAANMVESVTGKAAATADAAVAAAAETMETTIASAGDKPYQVLDGGISENAIEGWKTYNGGGCGTCHGKGGIGAVGPNLGDSVTQKLSKEEFENIVANGVSGTMMRPHKTNKRVMDNIDNLYAYLVARGDGVLGPGNLIKSPMGKE